MCWWLIAVILLTADTEIGRIEFEVNQGKKFKDPLQPEKKAGCGGVHLSSQLLQEA
jgi:hypothetical protein